MKIEQDTLKRIEQTRLAHEYLTFLVLENEIIVGIIQNETQKMMMIYNLEKLRDQKLQKEFLSYGDEWWWGSSRLIPVDSFIGKRFDAYREILIGYPKKSVKEVIGPTFNMGEQYLKRIKKRKIEIIPKTITVLAD